MSRAVGRLYLLQIIAIISIALSMYVPGLDLCLALFYLLAVWWEGRLMSNLPIPKQIGTGLIWQIPSLVLAFCIALVSPYHRGISDYAVFVFQLWQTPLVPFLSFIPSSTGFQSYSLLYPSPFFLLAILLFGAKINTEK